MKVEYLNPFLQAIAYVIEKVLGEKPVRGQIYLQDHNPYSTDDVAILVGITGTLQGQFVLSFDQKTAAGIASQMIKKTSTGGISTQHRSALSELANMITGNATIELSNAGFPCDITPPSLLIGTNIQVTVQEQIKTVVIPLKVSHGELFVSLSMIETDPVNSQ